MSSTTDLSPQRALFAAEYVLTGNGSKAARAADYKNAKQMAYKLLKIPAVIARIDNLRMRSSLQTNYTIADWFEGLQEATEEARKTGAWGAAMRGMELQGRHIGAFSNNKNLSNEDKRFYGYLAGAMQREAGAAERAVSGEGSGEDMTGITPPSMIEGTARILK